MDYIVGEINNGRKKKKSKRAQIPKSLRNDADGKKSLTTVRDLYQDGACPHILIQEWVDPARVLSRVAVPRAWTLVGAYSNEVAVRLVNQYWQLAEEEHQDSHKGLITNHNDNWRQIFQSYKVMLAQNPTKSPLEELRKIYPFSALYLAGNYPLAKVYFEKALAIVDNVADKATVKYNLGSTLFKLGEYRQALKCFYFRRKFSPNDDKPAVLLMMSLKYICAVELMSAGMH